MKKGRIAVDLTGIRRINLEVTEQMRNYVAEENHTGHGHYSLLPDGRFVEPHGPVDGTDRDCTHTVILLEAKWLRRDSFVTPIPRGAQSGAKALKLPLYAGVDPVG